MNGIQNRKAQNIEKQFPGCLGRMVNLFDLSSGVTPNRLLTDKPHHRASSLSRSRSDVAKMHSAAFEDEGDDEMIVSKLRRSSSNKKLNGTPMKKLIAREMSKEVGSRRNPPNLVAKLMGLDTLPHQQPKLAAEESQSRGYSRRSWSHSGVLMECWEQDHGFVDEQMQSEGHLCEEQNDYRDVYEIWPHSQNTSVRDSSTNKGKNRENVDERKMALVRQKFMEAKRLATDEKGRQSKEFQDALEVLSSNRDLFLQFLQEPNSMFSPHLHDMQAATPPDTKRITVLRPSKVIDAERFPVLGNKDDKLTNKAAQTGQTTVWNKNSSGGSPLYANQRFKESPAQPTRIVVLKPTLGKGADIKAVVSPPCSSRRTVEGEDSYDEPEDEEAQESGEVAKEITEQTNENMMGHRRDETLLSSVFSNGYIGDDSSFNKSDNEYAGGNLSDSEIVSPTSRHSWDYLNRFGSPYSSSSFSRASCSPESSVCREAKKRLSERWALMASNGSAQERKNDWRSSSTLGEMLALSNVNKSIRTEEEAADKGLERRGLAPNNNREEGISSSPKNLLRSKSQPSSATVHGTGLSAEVFNSEADRKEVSMKAKNAKSSLRVKVSSLFFSRNKKSNKEKCGASQSGTPSAPGLTMPPTGKIFEDASQCPHNRDLDNCLSPDLHGSSSSCPDLMGEATEQQLVSPKGALSVGKHAMPGNLGENQDQPSPISVLETPFEEDDSVIPEPPRYIRLNCQGAEVPLKSNLIDKSPPIESIARTLSWNDSYVEPATRYPLKPSSASMSPEEEVEDDDEDEQDWPSFIQSLLSAAGLDGNMRLDSFSFQWHSPETALDPALRNKYANLNDKDFFYKAKHRRRRSNRKLVFDCVNTALMEISSSQFDKKAAPLCSKTSPTVVDYVWVWMEEWFSREVKCNVEDSGDKSSLVVERSVSAEVVGKGWGENMRVELVKVGVDIEDKLLAELVEDVLVDLTTLV